MKNFIFLAAISGFLTSGFITAAQGMDQKYPYGGGYGSYDRSGGQKSVVNKQDFDAEEAALLARLAEIQDQKKKSQDQKGQFPLDSREVFINLKDDQKLPDLSYLTKLENLKVAGSDLKPEQLKELGKLNIKNLILYDLTTREVRRGIISLLPKILESLFVTDCHAKDLMALATHPNLKQFYTGSMNGTFKQGLLYVMDWSKSKIEDFGTNLFRFGINNLVDTELGLKKVTCNLLPSDFEETEKKLKKSSNEPLNPIFQTLESLNLILDGKEKLEYISKGLIPKIQGLFPNLKEITFSNAKLNRDFSLKVEEKGVSQGTLIQNKSLGEIMGDKNFDNNPPQQLTCRFSSNDLWELSGVERNFNILQPRPLFEKLKELNLILDQNKSNQKEQLDHVFNQEWISKMMGFFPNLKQITLWGAEKGSELSLNFTNNNPGDSFLSKEEWDSLL